jgi:hypothetical protein
MAAGLLAGGCWLLAASFRLLTGSCWLVARGWWLPAVRLLATGKWIALLLIVQLLVLARLGTVCYNRS